MKLLATLLFALPLAAHVGSPDVFYEGQAGPYRLLITIRPPQVIPGVAQVEIRSASPEVREVRIVPLRLTGPGAKFAPTPDLAQRSKEDPQFYTGALWLMSTGTWQVRVQVDGANGPAMLSVPVPAASTRVLRMQTGLAAGLIVLGVVLFLGMVSIVGAGSGEAQVEPGAAVSEPLRRRSRKAKTITALVLFFLVASGNRWWRLEAGDYAQRIFKPLALDARTEGDRLTLNLKDPGWLTRRTDDLLPDHGHLMHLYVIRIPDMDLVWHLHPERTGDASFTQVLPSMPAGRYALFGDIVHENGFPETVTAEINLPAIEGKPLTGDDSGGSGPPLAKADYNSVVSQLEDGYRMVWERGSEPLHARRPYDFRFRLDDSAGTPSRGMELYMGMQGHAAFVALDRSVFAHVHPSGSVPMAALSLTGTENPHAGHVMAHDELPAVVSFPYGFPKAGDYRLFVQVKRAGKVETGIFDVHVES